MKPAWVIAVFAAGIAVGLLIARVQRPDSPAQTAQVQQPADLRAPAAAVVTGAGEAVPSSHPGTPGSSAPPRPTIAPGADTAAPVLPQAAEADENSGFFQPIDVGPAFRDQFAQADKQGYKDQMIEAHRALEREVRDDSWSYPLEAEIDNSLLSETSNGNFKKEHVECRATMCEVRLSGQGAAQSAAIAAWNDNLHSQPWGSRLYMNSASIFNDNGVVNALLILMKPPKPSAPPNQEP